MKSKVLNILILSLQWLISLLLLVYLIVPVYENKKLSFSGDQMYFPYANWELNPIKIISLKNGVLIGSNPDNKLRIYTLIEEKPFLLIDTVKPNFNSPFLLGHSQNDLQFLLNKSNNNRDIIYDSKKSSSFYHPPLKGIHLQLVKKDDDFSLLDQFLSEGIPIAAIAGEGSEKYSYNQLMVNTGSPADCMKALSEGRNLMVISEKDIFSAEVESIPVIRKIEWKNNELVLDLSKIGMITVISSGFKLDTLSQNLHLKINKANWFRFRVDFIKDGISYISNPFFRYSQNPFKTIYPKANNQLTIFINLSWLLLIILLNYSINRIRNKYL